MSKPSPEDFGTAAEVLLVVAIVLAIIVSGVVVLMLGHGPAPHKESCGPRGNQGPQGTGEILQYRRRSRL